MRHLAARRRSYGVWTWCAVLLTVFALTLGTTSCGRQDVENTRVTPASAPKSLHHTTADLRPIRLAIPRIGVRTSVVSLGLNTDQTVEVPSDPAKAGWYRYGSAPGQSGSTVILGHVDSTAGPAVFYRLRLLTVGDHIDVWLANGSQVGFEVDNVATYPNDAFPAARIYRTDGASHLTLVTCGGRYDASRGGYQANLVVSARMMKPAATGGSHG